MPAALFVLLAGCVAVALAAPFSKTTSNDGSSVTAATLQPATGVGATGSCQQTATIGLVGTASASGAGSASVAKPTGTATGNVMIAGVEARGGSGTTITPPAGWTLIRRDDNTTSVASAVYWKLAGASETGPYPFSTSASARLVAGIVSYSGVDTAAPVHLSSTASGSSTSAGAPSLVTTIPNTRLIAFGSVRQTTFTATPPTGMTFRWNVDSAGGANSVGGAAADQAVAATGATGTRTFGATASGAWVTQSVALIPPGFARVAVNWTATSSTYATGYTLERWIGGTLDATFTIGSRSTTSYNDDTATSGTAYTYKLYANYDGPSTSWRSVVATASATPPPC